MDRHSVDQGALSVYAAVIRYKLQHDGVSPSIPELVELTGYNSTKPITDQLGQLVDMGLITRRHGTPRSIQVVGGKWSGPKPVKTLTQRQTDVYRAICAHAKKHDGNPPTLSDLGAILGLSSDSTARFHITSLKEQGLLASAVASHRSVRVIGATYEIDLDEVPECGRATASSVLAEVMAEQP